MAQRNTHQVAAMTVVPFAQAPQPEIELWALESAGEPRTVEPAAQAERYDARQQVIDLKRTLEEAANECGRLQSSLVSQQQLEQLLKQGRIHLQDLQSRLLLVTAERDQLKTEFTDHKIASQREIERLQTGLEETTREAFLQQTRAEQREREMLSKVQEQRHHIDALAEQLHKAGAERDRLAAELVEREAAHAQFAEERADERYTFERLLAEATSNQREMIQELDEKGQQLDTLREAAIRAQSLAREIMRAHEVAPTETHKS
jgi:hypothetical protein